jgi:hypothetical protein
MPVPMSGCAAMKVVHGTELEHFTWCGVRLMDCGRGGLVVCQGNVLPYWLSQTWHVEDGFGTAGRTSLTPTTAAVPQAPSGCLCEAEQDQACVVGWWGSLSTGAVILTLLCVQQSCVRLVACTCQRVEVCPVCVPHNMDIVQ